MWDEFITLQSSTYRELEAVGLVLLSFGEQLRNKFVKLYSDNQNVVRITHIGSMKPELQSLACSIYKTCLIFNIDLSLAWVPREFNR